MLSAFYYAKYFISTFSRPFIALKDKIRNILYTPTQVYKTL